MYAKEVENGKLKAVLIAGFLFIAFLHIVHLEYYSFVCDDAYITFRYTANWAEGHGPVFNIGERVEGYTNFLWMGALVPLKLVGIAPEAAAPLISIALSLLLISLVFLFPKIGMGEKGFSLWWLLAPLLLAINRSYAVWATSGLETRLFSLLIFLGGIFAWRYLRRDDPRDLLWMGLSLSLSELTRPEGALFFVVGTGLVLGWRTIQKKWPLSRREVVYIAVPLLVIVSHFLVRRWYYGEWLPNTYYAKMNKVRPFLGACYFLLFVVEYGYYFVIPLVLWKLLKAIKERGPNELFWLLFLFPHFMYVFLLGGDHFEFRFLDAYLAPLALVIQQGFRDLAGTINWRSFSRKQIFAVSLLVVFMVYHFSIPYASGKDMGPVYITGQFPKLNARSSPIIGRLPGFDLLSRAFERLSRELITHGACVRAEEHRLFGERQVRHGKLFQEFIEDGYLHSDDVICMSVVGAVPYYSGLTTVDYLGLTDAFVARQPATENGALFHEKAATSSYLELRGTDFIFTGDYLVNIKHGVPVSSNRSIYPDKWERRVYVVRIDEWILVFNSTRSPMWVIERFEPLGIEVYVMYRKPGEDEYRPFHLKTLLKSGALSPYD